MQKKMTYIADILDSSATSIDKGVLRSLLMTEIKPNESITIDGCTLLHLAAGIIREDVSLSATRELIKHSANPNFPNNEGKTSLHISASLGHKKVLHFLICNGGDLLLSDLNGNTPIDAAYVCGKKDTVLFLNYLLDTEEYEDLNKEKFSSYLWNRQLVEYTASFCSISSVPLTISCSICNRHLLIERDEPIRRSTSDIFAEFSRSTNLLTSNLVTNNISSSISNFDVTEQNYIETLDDSSSSNYLNNGFCCSYTTSSYINDEPILDFTKIDFTVKEPSDSTNSIGKTLSSQVVLNDSSQTYLTAVEEYVYKDAENDVEFIERRFLGTSDISGESSGNSETFYTPMHSTANSEEEESKESLPHSIKNLKGNLLKNKLKDLGFVSGPITETTCKVLQKYYHRLRSRPKVITEQGENKPKKYSKELELFFNTSTIDTSYYELLEEKMAQPFLNPDALSWWRNGKQKTCFNYLLLDPRITTNLALRRKEFTMTELFQKFLLSIFYIGKGTRSRPYYHLYEALSEKAKSKENLKVIKIKEIWRDGLGVISLHIFQNTIPVEAWTREASMIAAIGLNNLTNSIQGTYYGPASAWTKCDQRKFGSFCLYQSFNILLFEGERQIFPNNIPVPKWAH